jgi:hypothetical protein
MIEVDEFEAAAKRHKLKEEAAKEKKKLRQLAKAGDLMFKEDNPYDSEEKEYEAAEKAHRKAIDGEEAHEEGSYDSELEAEFFGKKDPEANKKLEF